MLQEDGFFRRPKRERNLYHFLMRNWQKLECHLEFIHSIKLSLRVHLFYHFIKFSSLSSLYCFIFSTIILLKSTTTTVKMSCQWKIGRQACGVKSCRSRFSLDFTPFFCTSDTLVLNFRKWRDYKVTMKNKTTYLHEDQNFLSLRYKERVLFVRTSISSFGCLQIKHWHFSL